MTEKPARATQIASTRINCSKSKKFSISFKTKIEISDASEKVICKCIFAASYELQICSLMEVFGTHRHMPLAKTKTCTEKELISRFL